MKLSQGALPRLEIFIQPIEIKGFQHMPVVLCEHDPNWKEEAEKIICDLQQALLDNVTGFEHVGSTAIPGIKAKPKLHIDILLKPSADLGELRRRLVSAGYADHGNRFRPDEVQLTRQTAKRLASDHPNQNETLMNHRVCLCKAGCAAAADRVAFRDRLISERTLALQYEALKERLASNHKTGPFWSDYSAGKTAFIKEVLASPIGR
ncbi:GrpB family protein [uncultured Roseibium sp.]|uniref:GrpB family protein n=1 Tax=uncultured Roseibium sp. TaxID=1936171 RepID=UPI00263A0BD5|nr:GrpB family protein [uncultured Roseibium sp.]